MLQELSNVLRSLGLRNDADTVKAVNSVIPTIDQAIPPVPFAFSALVQTDTSASGISGFNSMLDVADEVPADIFGEGGVLGFVFYLDTQRGAYWGDIVISVQASEIFDVDILLATIDNTQCNSLVTADFNDSVVAGEAYTVSITATGGEHSVTRTFTLNIEEE
jgi:hypothetical protein